MERSELIYDWEAHGPNHLPSPKSKVMLDDETLRDGLQCPSVVDPPLDTKIELIHLMNDLGIDTANIGLPGAGPNPREHILTLAHEMTSLSITPNVACRTVTSDIEPVVDMVHQLGAPIEVCAFIGSSPIRAYAEDWDLDRMENNVRDAVGFGSRNGLPIMFVTEDTVRSTPETLTRLFTAALEEGAQRLCLCDTVGSATPAEVRNLVRWTRKFLAAQGRSDIGIDWHGHRDRGLGLINTLAAISGGATRAHGAAMGIGERAGNTEMDLLLVNLKIAGWIDRDLTKLGDYVRAVAKAVGRDLRHEYPVFGADAFETGTGVHAAAVIKALRKGDAWLADRVYSGVPAGEFGMEQGISVGPMSGKSNVIFKLEKLGIDPSKERVEAVLGRAKNSDRLLSDAEVTAAALAAHPA
ncbi:MAG: 2-isopropylmalate synthase [Planctomycetes bacterium]|nr:2-isopropylmalate synthase [Planctomycetota bacterium]